MDQSDHPISNGLRSERPVALAHKRYVESRASFQGLDVASRFALIHKLNLWGAQTTASGLGSEPEATSILRSELGPLLRSLGVRSLLDVPCGDGRWMSAVDLESIAYVGVDIVADLIAALQAAQEPKGTYVRLNLIDDPLPRMDAVLCRDALVHLSFANAVAAAANLRSAAKRWVIATTFPDVAANQDCEDGDWRPLNMTMAPFGWPEPNLLLNEGCQEDGGGWGDKSLGFWRTERLP